ncbi:hydroxypyruvate isomerase family protein [Rubinisphaera margarita]|uniref:hydroxypyruvate isomerase family protein n=1 Tax=Rubinisphaera margarita TaxID=2909586 RepID=UPI001EE8FEFE|nr:TIM barrel protein [Rubinisphaera margarita]MCG6158070.1 TIM barrel protein [Rubinisphaera margarita]
MSQTPEQTSAEQGFLSNRRTLLQGAVAASAGLLVGRQAVGKEAASGKVAKNGRIKQSLVHWCYRPYWNVEEMCQLCVDLGVPSIELIDPEHWPTLKKHGLTCAIAGSHGFKAGPNDPKNWEACEEILTKRIKQAAEFGCPSVITFTGMSGDLTPEEGADNCVKFFKRIMPLAEKHKINVCLEHLNTRDDTHPMKGHPGYQGNHVEYCIDLCERVGSERMKLLFDIYHVQIMDGDVIRRIRQHKDYLGHIHTAGNPGRGELDNTQEINYPAVMQALLDVGYDGYVGQEYIPTRDALTGLQQAVALCDV